MPQTVHRKLDIRLAERRIDNTSVQLQRVVFIGTSARTESTYISYIELLSLPGLQPFFELFREAVGISRGAESFLGEDGRGLMVAMPIAAGTLKPCC